MPLMPTLGRGLRLTCSTPCLFFVLWGRGLHLTCSTPCLFFVLWGRGHHLACSTPWLLALLRAVGAWPSRYQLQNPQIITLRPLFQIGFEMCFIFSTLGVGNTPRLESRVQKFHPSFGVCRYRHEGMAAALLHFVLKHSTCNATLRDFVF